MTLDYELAKELKDGGFSFKEVPGERLGGPFNDFGDGKLYFDPTLSEIIEAVRINHLSVYRHADFVLSFKRAQQLWRAASIHRAMIKGFGATPEEAVARLWLALNKKT